MHAAIQCEGLSKEYKLGRVSNDFPTLREALSAGARSMGASLARRRRRGAGSDMFWALRDVSFTVGNGEVVGVIGSNGAGKSTLLKILSRITLPTAGEVKIRGRLASLLEVGTGFHPELTGRENIFLNGAILGMKREEIRRKFDDIVAFAEVEKFIDTAVKHYSSGMYLRLAFAVAAHLEPEILLVDEVLAVGDAAFQKKCLGKMSDVARHGRTILFVSHNLGAVQSLCSRAIYIREGTVAADDTAANTIALYLRMLEQAVSVHVAERVDRRGDGLVRLTGVTISTTGEYSSLTLASGRPARFVFEYAGRAAGLECSFTIYDQFGSPVTYFDSAEHGREDIREGVSKGISVSRDEQRFICDVDELLLIPGRYRINVGLTASGEMQDHLEAAAILEVEQGDLRGRPVTRETGYGSMLIPHRWTAPG